MRGGNGLVEQLRRPPGGRDARVLLLARFLDRIGSGVWTAAAATGWANWRPRWPDCVNAARPGRR